LVLGGVIWYKSRPEPPKPWNTSALKASYDSIDTEGDKSTFVFYYILENETNNDYKIENAEHITFAARLEQEKSLSIDSMGGADQLFKLDYPLFVPAKQRVRIAIHFAETYGGSEKIRGNDYGAASLEELRRFHKAVTDDLKKEDSNLDGFVFFDETNRYQINFPRGW
jgi:hypothetical protein